MIKFPNGTEVKITPKPLRMPAIARPEKLVDAYDQLRSMAEAGDWSASYSLHRWLTECGRVPADEASLESMMAERHKHGRVTIPSNPPRTVEKTTIPDGFEAGIREAFFFCQGVTPEQRAQAAHWQELSVESGELISLRVEANEMRRASREHYAELVRTLWTDYGDISALSQLARINSKGSAGDPPNQIAAYAYQLIEFKIMESVYTGSVYPSHRNMLQAMEDALANSASYLTPEQTAQAVALASRLLAESPNCCTGRQFGTWY